MNDAEIKKVVREGFASIARQNRSCCSTENSCCGSTNTIADISKKIGYSDEELVAVPEGANLGLGCGNPVALASLQEGEIVLDLGSGAGFDCFLAANKVGDKGRIIGIDMTPEMIAKARENAARGNYKNVEFRLGEIENLPVADNYGDIIISNCVINLAPDKSRVFKEAFRVLKPGGRIMISDIVLLKTLPDIIKESIAAYVSCLSGAALKNDYINTIKNAGFANIEILSENKFPVDCITSDPIAKSVAENLNLSPETINDISSSIISIKVSAIKPG
jgi:arsenite methyltransferase